MKKLEMSSKRVWCKIAYGVHSSSDSNLLTVRLFRNLFPNTSTEQLQRFVDNHAVLQHITEQVSCN